MIVSSFHVGGKKYKKARNLIFFLVGANCSTSEESLTIEYIVCALTHNFKVLHHLVAAAGHLSDALIADKWTVLSVRRLMTSIGLLGPGIFLLFFSAVNNLLLAVM